jgi:prepilin-type N-terminal cleavage/methylation domain-containing protein
MMRKFLNKKKKRPARTYFKGGFTLIEILITIFIITLIGLSIINFQIDVFSLNKRSSDNLDAQIDARKTLKVMSAELRSTSPSNNGSYPLAITATSSLLFYSDVDSDNLKEQIRYFKDGSILKKGLIKPTGTPLVYNPTNEKITILVNDLANSSSSPVFYYYDKNYDGAGSALTYPINTPSVRLIKVDIFIDKDINKSPSPINVTTQVSLRNLKDNL